MLSAYQETTRVGQIVSDVENEATLKPLLLETGGAMKVAETAVC